MKADVAIITALGKEIDAILKHGKDKYGLGWNKIPGKHSIRTYYEAVNKVRTRIVAVQASGMGQLHAAIVTSDVINDFSPKVILLVGIAAGIADQVQLGDIVISNQLIDYEPGKQTEEGMRSDFPVYQSATTLLAKLRDYRDNEWKSKIMSGRPDGDSRVVPGIHIGDIFCGNKVVADQQIVDGLKKHFRKALALEMESAGIAALLNQRERPPHFSMIKAICDHGNSAKDDRWQQYAADASASFTLAFLEDTQLFFGKSEIIVPSQTQIDEHIQHVIEFVAPDLHSLEIYQRDLTEKIVTSGLKEVADLLSGRYQADVALGRQFLLRAGPLFGKASRIYATSIDTVSTFWTNSDNRAEAGEYLQQQAPGGEAMRLFVFSDADSAHKHVKVLDAHQLKYAYVYICSMDYYRSLLEGLIPSGGSIDELLNRDFSILFYGNGQKRTHQLFAELDSRSLSYQQIDLNGSGKIIYRAIVDLFDRWKSIPEGRFVPQNKQVLRWENRLWKDQKEWTRVLQTMFNERTSDAIHMIFLQVDQYEEDSLRRWLADMKQRISTKQPGESQSMMAKYGIQRIWIGRKMQDQKAYDGLFKGLISATPVDAESYVLIMRFDTEEGLMRFYQDKNHSIIRKELYEKLDPRVKVLYDLLEGEELAMGNERAVAYEAIEAMVGRYIHRRDYLDDEMIEQMVMTVKPYDF